MSRLAFLDCETTGLTPSHDRLLEVGAVIVELPSFEIVAEDHWVFHYDIKKPHGYIHPKVVEMHKANGLWDACFKSQLADYQKLDSLVSAFLVAQGCQGAPLAGANPDFDKRFMVAVLPQTLGLFHYRNFDTNSFWLLKSFITGNDAKRSKPASHRAVDDCKDAIKQVEEFFEFVSGLTGANQLTALVKEAYQTSDVRLSAKWVDVAKPWL